MKKSIFFAIFVLLITAGWLASGQLGKVKADDDENSKINSYDDSNDEKTKKGFSNLP